MGDYSGESDHSLNLAIAKFCPNLRELSSGFKNDELETLKMIFNSCQYLESIRIWCSYKFLSEQVALEMVKKYSPKSLYELILHYQDFVEQELLPEELESFFVSWGNRTPLYLIINNNDDEDSLERNYENMKIIEKYFELGIVKKFEVIHYYESKILIM